LVTGAHRWPVAATGYSAVRWGAAIHSASAHDCFLAVAYCCLGAAQLPGEHCYRVAQDCFLGVRCCLLDERRFHWRREVAGCTPQPTSLALRHCHGKLLASALQQRWACHDSPLPVAVGPGAHFGRVLSAQPSC
jgi:hypothetical protein